METFGGVVDKFFALPREFFFIASVDFLHEPSDFLELTDFDFCDKLFFL